MTLRRFALCLTLLCAVVLFVAGCGQKSATPELKSQAQVQDVAQQRAADMANRYQQQKGQSTPPAP